MKELSKILKLRVLLCFTSEDKKNCTVTGIAKMLGEEKYTISRIFSAMEQEGLLNKQNTRSPSLTLEGIKLASYYAERVNCITECLIQKGVDIIHATQDALYGALYCSDAVMELLWDLQTRQHLKQPIKNQMQINGAALCRKMSDGAYSFNFVIYKERSENGSLLSAANRRFENPCIISVSKGVGILHMYVNKVPFYFVSDGTQISHRVSSVMYYDCGKYMAAEKRGNVFSIPMAALIFTGVNSRKENFLHGSVQIKLVYSVGGTARSESVGIFTMII